MMGFLAWRNLSRVSNRSWTCKSRQLGGAKNGEYQKGEVWLLPAIHIARDAQSTSPNEVVVYNGWMLKVVVDKQRIVRVMEFQQASDGKQVTVERE